jgi:hypothetical protein
MAFDTDPTKLLAKLVAQGLSAKDIADTGLFTMKDAKTFIQKQAVKTPPKNNVQKPTAAPAQPSVAQPTKKAAVVRTVNKNVQYDPKRDRIRNTQDGEDFDKSIFDKKATTVKMQTPRPNKLMAHRPGFKGFIKDVGEEVASSMLSNNLGAVGNAINKRLFDKKKKKGKDRFEEDPLRPVTGASSRAQEATLVRAVRKITRQLDGATDKIVSKLSDTLNLVRRLVIQKTQDDARNGIQGGAIIPGAGGKAAMFGRLGLALGLTGGAVAALIAMTSGAEGHNKSDILATDEPPPPPDPDPKDEDEQKRLENEKKAREEDEKNKENASGTPGELKFKADEIEFDADKIVFKNKNGDGGGDVPIDGLGLGDSRSGSGPSERSDGDPTPPVPPGEGERVEPGSPGAQTPAAQLNKLDKKEGNLNDLPQPPAPPSPGSQQDLADRDVNVNRLPQPESPTAPEDQKELRPPAVMPKPPDTRTPPGSPGAATPAAQLGKLDKPSSPPPSNENVDAMQAQGVAEGLSTAGPSTNPPEPPSSLNDPDDSAARGTSSLDAAGSLTRGIGDRLQSLSPLGASAANLFDKSISPFKSLLSPSSRPQDNPKSDFDLSNRMPNDSFSQRMMKPLQDTTYENVYGSGHFGGSITPEGPKRTSSSVDFNPARDNNVGTVLNSASTQQSADDLYGYGTPTDEIKPVNKPTSNKTEDRVDFGEELLSPGRRDHFASGFPGLGDEIYTGDEGIGL